MRRTGLVVRAAAAAVAALLLAACGGSGGGSGDVGAAGSSPAAASGAASNSSLKVAILLNGSTADKGYNATGKDAADELKKQLGAEVAVTENVSVPNQADVYRQYAAKGYNLIIGWGGQFTDGATSVSAEFPKTTFVVLNSDAANGTNVGSIDINVEQWEFVAGYVMAKMSKTGTVGWIGGQCFPATAANLHGIEQGAKYANPNVKVVSTFTGDFEDPTKGQQAAQAMIGAHADALTGVLNNAWFGVLKAAQSSGNTIAVTEWIDNRSLAPDVIASSILKSEVRFVVEVAKKVADGTFEAKHYQFGLPGDWGPVLTKTDLLPQNLYDEATNVQQKISSGEIKVQHDTSCPK